MTVPLLELDALGISYRRRGRWHAAVRDLSLNVAPGEAVGLVGESGCGKSTVAMAALGYLPGNARIDTGAVRVAGTALAGLDAAALRRLRGGVVAAVYQSPGAALNPSLTVGEQVAEVYRLHGGLDRPAARQAAGEMLARVRIADPGRLLEAYPYQLSGGMQQRVVIAMALAGNPELLVLDEPTTALDATVQAEILDLFARLRAELGVALLFISHDLGVVESVCDRVGVMYAGELVECGPAAAVFREPAHPYSASLIDCIPDFHQHWADARLAAIPGLPPALGERPTGCAFAARCPIARDACRQGPVALATVAPGRLSRCLFPAETAPPGGNRRPAEAAPRPPGPELLAVEGLAVDFGPVRVLDGVSLAIRQGETLALVGESGSGKTTLARAVTGLGPATAGAMQFNGRALAAAAGRREQSVRRRLQMVFQSPDDTLNPSHRVGASLRRALRVLGGAKGAEGRRLLEALLAAVALEPAIARRRPGQLSGGQRQRVAIARAFTGRPELVILDEPTSALDVSVQAAILDLLIDLQQRDGTAYLFISHDLAVVRYLADRVAVLYLGQVVEEGAVDAVFRGHRHPYTEALLSAVPGSGRRRSAVEGGTDNPGPAARPPGCAFHTRCPHAMAVCAQTPPPVREPQPGHRIRCHLPVAELPQG